MFTGIIEAVGQLEATQSRGEDVRLVIGSGGLEVTEGGLGASIAVNGVCLTAVDFTGRGFTADVSAETLRCTTIGRLKVGDPVNLERALTLQRQLGGHLVSGHVDAVGSLVARGPEGRSERMTFRVPAELARYIAEKGSVAIDGISLTVNRVQGSDFDVNIVPHTQGATTLSDLRPGEAVNIEVDVVARYLERLLQGPGRQTGVSEELLRRSGFIGT